MYQALFFSLSRQRNEEAKKKKITPDLRLPPDGFKLSLKLLCYRRYFFYPVFVLDLCMYDTTPPLGTSLFWVLSVCVAACGSCKSVTLSVLCVCRQVG